MLEYANSEWFKHLFTYVKRWYDVRYGEALNKSAYKRRIGAVFILGTPFIIEVPTATRELVEPGESFWLCRFVDASALVHREKLHSVVFSYPLSSLQNSIKSGPLFVR